MRDTRDDRAAPVYPGVNRTPGVEHRMLQLSDGPVSAYVAGDPAHPPVVLLHGAMYDEARFTWDQLFPRLASTYRVYAVDIPRHGRSRPWTGSLTHERLLRILSATFEELGLAKFTLVGLSMGGGLAIGYAAENPDAVTCLVLFEPGGLGDKIDHHLLTWAWIHSPGTRRLMNRRLARKNDDDLERTLRKLYVNGTEPVAPHRLVGILSDEIAGKNEFAESDLDDWQTSAICPFRLRWNLLDQIPKIACPSLWLHGDESTLVSAGDMERAVALAGTAAKLAVISKAGHMLPLEQPEEVGRAVTDYLATHTQPG